MKKKQEVKKLVVNKGIRIVLNVPYDEKPELLEHISRVNELIRYASKELYPFVANVTEVEDKKHGKMSILELIRKLKTTLPYTLQTHSRNLFNLKAKMKELGYSGSGFERMICGMVGKYYKGMDKRNGDFKVPVYQSRCAPSCKKYKSVHYWDGMGVFKFTYGDVLEFQEIRHKLSKCVSHQVELKTYAGVKSLHFSVRTNQTHLVQEYLNKRSKTKKNPYIYGNLVPNLKFNQDGTINPYKTTFHFVINHSYEEDFAYVPTQALGFDLNQRKDVFAVFSDNRIGDINLTNQNKLNDLIEERKKINAKIDNRRLSNLNSRQRQGFRNRWKKLDNLICKEIKELGIIDRIINFARTNQYLVAIDALAFGDKSGFGQSQFIHLLKEALEKEKIPFVVVKTKFTSQICNECLNQNIEARTGRNDKQDSISCTRCRKNYHADKNAAKNIAFFGWRLWSTGEDKRPNWPDRKVKYQDFSFDKDVLF
jgi:hypothetical protein